MCHFYGEIGLEVTAQNRKPQMPSSDSLPCVEWADKHEYLFQSFIDSRE